MLRRIRHPRERGPDPRDEGGGYREREIVRILFCGRKDPILDEDAIVWVQFFAGL
jgi:hypothetical protein